MRRIVGCALAALLVAPGVAMADSDGHYCVGPGYLAYETRWTDTTAVHYLHIVTYSRASGIKRLAPVPLQDFQVHGMTCEPGAVQVEGWTAGYTVSFAATGPATVTERPTRRTPRGAPANLGHYSRDSVVDLPSDGAPGEFQLVVARASRRQTGGTDRYTLTDVIWRTVGRTTVRAWERLYSGIFRETVD